MSRTIARSPLARALSQHSLRNAAVADRIVAHSGLAPPDVVFEAGAGAGTLTAAIAPHVRRVVAIEQDRASWAVLRECAARWPNVEPVLGDFLQVPLPRSGPYKVVANVPFNISASIVRHLLLAPNPPRRASLVLQREAALRWTGDSRESVASVLAKVGFEFQIPLAFRRFDFSPYPNVDCVLLALERRPRPLLPPGERHAFRLFVEHGFGGGRMTLVKNLGALAPPAAVASTLRDFGLGAGAAPGEVPFEGWLALFDRSRRAPRVAAMAAPRRRR